MNQSFTVQSVQLEQHTVQTVFNAPSGKKLHITSVFDSQRTLSEALLPVLLNSHFDIDSPV